jgi:glycosyltransferase involved in cell wall biosynthesis
MTKNKKILLVGGEDIYQRLDLAKYLEATFGCSVIMCGSGSRTCCEDEGFTFFDLHLSRKLNPFADLITIYSLVKTLKATEPDLVHFFDTKLGFLGPISLLISHSPRMKVVRTVTGMGKIFSKQTLFNKVLQFLYVMLHKVATRSVDITLFQNKHDENFFRRKIMSRKDRSELIFGSGINIDNISAKETIAKMESESERELHFVCVSRMIEEKGIRTLLKSFENLEGGSGKLDLVGPCFPEEPAGLKCEELHGVKNVRYLGVSSNVNEMLKNYDVFIYPSKYSEGVPRAVMEAMAVGLPIIASNAPGLSDLINKSGGGILVVSDTKYVTEAVNKFGVLPKSKLLAMGLSGRNFVLENCSNEKVFRKLSDVYSSLYCR